MKKALFYDPYLDSLGGGERYMLTLTQYLISQGWDTVILWDGNDVSESVLHKFNLDISKARYLSLPKNLWQRCQLMRSFDLVFWVSDGSLPLLFGKQNLIHMQVPFHHVQGGNLLNKIKNLMINKFVTNSQFTKQVVDREYGVESQVIYPPVDVSSFYPMKKKKAILYSARFSNLLQQKGHAEAISAFKKMFDSGIKDYELWLVGGTAVGSDNLLVDLKFQAGKYPIKFYLDVDFLELQKLYGQAKFFWSAVGYDADEITEPERCEHFGIAVIEAMAAGCAAIVLKKGGYREIVRDRENGYFWENIEDLVAITRTLIKDSTKFSLISTQAVKDARRFSQEVFLNSFQKLIKSCV